MKRLIFFFLLTAGPCISYAQERYLEFSDACIIDSLFSGKTTVIDARADTNAIGFIKTGAFNKYRPLRFKTDLTQEMEAFYNAAKKENDKHLIIYIQNFFVSEKTGAMSEKGFFRLAADYFMKTEAGNYSLLLHIDTTYENRGMDVTKALLRGVTAHLCENMLTLATNPNSEAPTYTRAEISDYVNLQKKKIPVYGTAPVKGLYKTWEEFKTNSPSVTNFSYDSAKGKLFVNQEGTLKKISNKEVYAFCTGDSLYKVTPLGIYSMRFANGEFLFTGKTKDYAAQAANSSTIAASTIMFGLAGGLLAAAILSGPEDTDLYKFILDYRNGSLVPIEKIPQPKSSTSNDYYY